MQTNVKVKCWGVELELSTDNVTIKNDLGKSECFELSENFMESSKEMFKYAVNSDDLSFAKHFIDELELNDADIEELIDYLKNYL